MNNSLVASILVKGGFFVYPILICSVTALAIFLKKFFVTNEKNILPATFLVKLNTLVDNNKHEEALELCKNNQSVFSNIASAILTNKDSSLDDLERIVDDEGSKQVFLVSKNNEMLGSLSNISTLLGLLGTISGMITVFGVISSQPVVDPPSLAGGISEALYTTAFGLMVAIPSFIGYKFISNRISEISVNLQNESKKLILKARKMSWFIN